MNQISRSQFLRGDWGGDKAARRPPWALDEPAFSEACDGCMQCVSACSQNIIIMSFRKLPLMDFTEAGCTFCGDCSESCETGALRRGHVKGEPPWQLSARISDACLSEKGTLCVSCTETCEYGAILTRPALGGRVFMKINKTACTGCGMCISSCPVNAISLEISADRQARKPRKAGVRL